jgi:hypothetical protein
MITAATVLLVMFANRCLQLRDAGVPSAEVFVGQFGNSHDP